MKTLSLTCARTHMKDNRATLHYPPPLTRQGTTKPVDPSRACHAQQLEKLAFAVSRLTTSHRDPERFFMDRSEVVEGMQALARLLAENR